MFRRFRFPVRVIIAAFAIALVAGELIARYAVGLGDPPLSMAHPDIEYMFRPCQDCRRFGNRIAYNCYSMRSDDFHAHRQSPDELRVMVLGDSVINGGNLTDQADLATQILQSQLAEQLNRPVVVGNISAGSWGPPNQLAYVEQYGLFDADVVLIVLSSHDADDMPTFAPVVGTASYPDTRPVSALAEGISRYAPRYLPGLGRAKKATMSAGSADAESDLVAQQTRFRARDALAELVDLIRRADARPVIIHHATPGELADGYEPGDPLIRDFAREHGVPYRQMGDRFRAALEAGQHPYRDNIHPNALGQRLLADELRAAVLEQLESQPGPRTTPPQARHDRSSPQAGVPFPPSQRGAGRGCHRPTPLDPGPSRAAKRQLASPRTGPIPTPTPPAIG